MEETNDSWIEELELLLKKNADVNAIKSVARGRPLPPTLRSGVWKICLESIVKDQHINQFNDVFDLPEQSVIRRDCHDLVERLGNEAEEQVSVASDVESIVTHYCKSCGQQYERNNGWLDILQPLLTLRLNRSSLYNCFYSILTNYIPKDVRANGRLCQLFRLLLQYHDSELCSFFDSKRVLPDAYILPWFRSLFSAVCDLEVTQVLWDIYLQHGDPFFVFFIALIILINAREVILAMKSHTAQQIIAEIVSYPSGLKVDDIEDMVILAKYYATRTPQSFRWSYESQLFGVPVNLDKSVDIGDQALCLQISVSELLPAPDTKAVDAIQFHVVDCRPAAQYNSGHLPGSSHLDASLMMSNPIEFSASVQQLVAHQKEGQSAEAALPALEHLCVVGGGSGDDEEEQLLVMVVANLLQRNCQFVSTLVNGFHAIHSALRESLETSLYSHDAEHCFECNPAAREEQQKQDLSILSSASDSPAEKAHSTLESTLADRFEKLSTVVKAKSAVVKEKVINYIKNEQPGVENRHVSTSDNVSKPYRNIQSVFTIADDEDDEEANHERTPSDDGQKELISLDVWLNKPDIIHAYPCSEVKENGQNFPSHLLITKTHMYVMRDSPTRKGMAFIQSRRALISVLRITSKKNHPEFITFKYGTTNDKQENIVTDVDRFIIAKAGDATKAIKYLIINLLQNQ